MMLKGHQQASSQAATGSRAPARLSSLVASVPAKRRHAAFKSSRQTVRILATAQPEEAAPAPAANSSRAPKREVTVQLAQVKPGDEFEGVITGIEGYGAFVNFGAEKEGLVHISQLSNTYVSSIAEAVKVNDAVKVRVLSIDAASGKIALTMKTESAAAAGGADAGAYDDDVADEVADDDEMVPADGHEFVYADAVADFAFPFQMEEEDAELSVNVLNDFEDAEMEYERVLDLPVPLNELVTGKVTRMEEYGAFITVAYGNQEYKAFLERDEAKIPSSALSPEELAEYVEAGDELVPEYLEAEFDDMRAYYKVGDQVSAFVLDYTDRGEMNLTQYTDVEVEADGFELEEDEFEQADPEPLSMMGSTTVDVLAQDPEDLLEEEESSAQVAADGEDADMNAAVSEYKVYGRRGPLSGALFNKGDMSMPAVNFPDRPLDKVDSYAINSLNIVDRDFDGDEIYLDDLWQESIPVPKDALKRLGLKVQYDDKGEAEVVEREGGAVEDEEDVMLSLAGDHQARVAAFVADLLDEDEDEAEVPALAMRRPL